ncbi:MAG: hypothetical protein ACI9B2_000371 [Flavobacteriales bacterium]|jgi:hypothetical protein
MYSEPIYRDNEYYFKLGLVFKTALKVTSKIMMRAS